MSDALAAAVRVKVCCITSVHEAQVAVSAGAAALGLVAAMPSGPGVIDESLIAEIAAQVPPPVATFLLTPLQRADAILEQHERCKTSTIQLVDRVEHAELRKLRKQLGGTRLVQVIHVTDEASVAEACGVAPLVDALLLDSGNQSLAVRELGGTGRIHDWSLRAWIRAAAAKPVFLAGGLCSENIGAALATVRPFGIDLCNGVREGGALSSTKLCTFMVAVERASRIL